MEHDVKMKMKQDKDREEKKETYNQIQNNIYTLLTYLNTYKARYDSSGQSKVYTKVEYEEMQAAAKVLDRISSERHSLSKKMKTAFKPQLKVLDDIRRELEYRLEGANEDWCLKHILGPKNRPQTIHHSHTTQSTNPLHHNP